MAILVFTGTFFYWYFWIRKVKEPKIPEERVEEIPEEIPEEIVVPPPSLVEVEESEEFEITEFGEIPSLLSEVLEKELEEGYLKRILIKKMPEEEFLTLGDFFAVFEIESPEKLLENLAPEFTLLLHSLEERNSLGFVAKIKEKEGFFALLESWEETMEEDTEELFLILGKKEKAPSPDFKTAEYKDVSFHYLSFPQEGLGICWAIIEDYFVFTSSSKTIFKVIDLLL